MVIKQKDSNPLFWTNVIGEFLCSVKTFTGFSCDWLEYISIENNPIEHSIASWQTEDVAVMFMRKTQLGEKRKKGISRKAHFIFVWFLCTSPKLSCHWYPGGCTGVSNNINDGFVLCDSEPAWIIIIKAAHQKFIVFAKFYRMTPFWAFWIN